MFSHSRWWNETNHHQLLLHTKLAWLSMQMHSGICLTFIEKLKCSWQISYPLLKTSVTNIFLHIWFPYVRFLTSCFPSTCYSGKLRQPYDVRCKANKDFRGKLIDFQKKMQFQKYRVFRVSAIICSLKDQSSHLERYYQDGCCLLFKSTEKEVWYFF